MQKMTKRLQGMPIPVRWILGSAFSIPILIVQYGLIAGTIVVWAKNAPQAWKRLATSARLASQTSSKRRTPTEIQSLPRLNFDDVRARINELTEYPKQ